MIYPKKLRGPKGLPGDDGATPEFSIGTVVEGPASATITGTSANPILNLTLPQGPSGISKRIETYTGTTDANGLFTVTYPAAFSATPSIQPEPHTSNNYMWVKVSSTASGFSMRLVARASLNVLGLDVLASAVTNVSGASVRAVVIEV